MVRKCGIVNSKIIAKHLRTCYIYIHGQRQARPETIHEMQRILQDETCNSQDNADSDAENSSWSLISSSTASEGLDALYTRSWSCGCTSGPGTPWRGGAAGSAGGRSVDCLTGADGGIWRCGGGHNGLGDCTCWDWDRDSHSDWGCGTSRAAHGLGGIESCWDTTCTSRPCNVSWLAA